ncbi:nucleotide disphospho-sugar-binding domain-containing protein [Streptomyces tendae]|uniref:nucleotide disphospho-sugar-binding domain-containing protein n=1 Tax=Streptomyces tendae TaxID=1932 RepID=UPI00342D94E1
MKALFYAAGTSPASAFAIGPLASALRASGHDILVASFEEMSDAVTGVGLPSLPVARGHTTESIKAASPGKPAIEYPHQPEQEMPYLGHWFGRQGSHVFDDLVKTARTWGADVLVAGSQGHGAEIAARYLGVPFVRQSWDLFDVSGYEEYLVEEMADELAKIGSDTLPEPSLKIDICPPGLTGATGTFMRWTPHNKQRAIEPWMLEAPDSGRVCLTMGSFRYAFPGAMDRISAIVEGLLELEVEVVVAIGEAEGKQLQEKYPRVRAGWIPLEAILPTCEVIIHPAGGLTAINAINTATPQLILNPFEAFIPRLKHLTGYGCARTLYRDEGTPEAIAQVVKEMLGDSSYCTRARNLADKAATAPPAVGMVPLLEELVAGEG